MRKKVYPSCQDIRKIINAQWYRASGLCECEICGKQYYDHKPLYGFNWLLKLCNGDLIKY